ncbi:MAG: DUF2946 family protein [Rhodospirillales bacterium]|nr:DUF2946 family protein [Rhodospirillales bacterium]
MLAILSFNLLAVALLPASASGFAAGADSSVICHAVMETAIQQDPTQPEGGAKPSGFCVFCLPLLHAGPVGAQTPFQSVRFETLDEIRLPILSRQPEQALPPGTSAPRAPPAYS